MKSEIVATGLRTLRKKSGLSQRELAHILGFQSEIPVVRHERSQAIPNLLTALAYEVIFQAPISAQFRGLFESVEAAIEGRLAELEHILQQSDTRGRSAVLTARKLEFLNMRRESESNQQTK
jgi:DNA-binding XRE family transcriptional regulator